MTSLHKSPGQKEVGQINIDNIHDQIQNLTKQKLKVKLVMNLHYDDFSFTRQKYPLL